MEQSGSRIPQTFDHVIVTLPPRLSGLIQWRPALPESVHDQLRTTPTWMAGQAKVVAVYDIPFWRQAGHPIAVLYQDWAKEPEMAVKADAEPLTDFPDYRSIRLEGALQDKVTLLGTESDPTFGGHLEGTLQSVERWLTTYMREDES